MKLGKVFKDRKRVIAFLLLVVVVFLSVGGGLYFSNKKEKETAEKTKEENNNIQQEIDQDNTDQETDYNPVQKPQTNQGKTDEGQQATDTLARVSLEGTLLKEENDDIKVVLFGDPAVYKVQKLVDKTWVTVVANVNYSSKTGLDFKDRIPVSETERVYRVYQIIDGKVVGPKQITVDRNLVVSKDGVNSFPGAL